MISLKVKFEGDHELYTEHDRWNHRKKVYRHEIDRRYKKSLLFVKHLSGTIYSKAKVIRNIYF